jgi:photosystem II stability/assembly factor-like uncharacterized protein
MTDFELDDDLDREVRVALRTAIDPPAPPQFVCQAVADLARNHGRSGRATLRPVTIRSHASALMRLAAALAIAALVGFSLAARGNHGPGTPNGERGPVVAFGSTQGAYGWASGLVGWYTSGSGVRLTVDGGVTWSAIRPVPAAPGVVQLDQFVDAFHGWTSSTSTTSGTAKVVVYRTADGGLTWQSAAVGSFPYHSDFPLPTSLHFTDAQHGIVLVDEESVPGSPSDPSGPTYSSNCHLYSTDDGGSTWSERPGAPCNTLVGPTFPTPLVGYLATLTTGTLSVTVDGGRTWKTAPLPDAVAPRQIWVQMIEQDSAGALHLLVSETQDGPVVALPIVILISRDGGASWSEEYRAPTPNGSSLDDVVRVGTGHWIALQESGDPASYPNADQLIETRDSGRTWKVLPSTGFTIAGAMAFGDAQHGILQGILATCPPPDSSDGCGGSGQLFHTTDGGRSWQPLDP